MPKRLTDGVGGVLVVERKKWADIIKSWRECKHVYLLMHHYTGIKSPGRLWCDVKSHLNYGH